MKQILQGATALLVVALGWFALADVLQAGGSYATTVLSVTAAVVALITLFTATDADRLHRQLDALHTEVSAIRRTRSERDQLPSAGTSQRRPPRERRGPRVARAGVVGLVVAVALARYLRGKLNRRRSKWHEKG
jgi:hypothetical protein